MYIYLVFLSVFFRRRVSNPIQSNQNSINTINNNFPSLFKKMDIYITLYKTVGRTVKYKSVIEKKKNQNQNQKQNDETN